MVTINKPSKKKTLTRTSKDEMKREILIQLSYNQRRPSEIRKLLQEKVCANVESRTLDVQVHRALKDLRADELVTLLEDHHCCRRFGLTEKGKSQAQEILIKNRFLDFALHNETFLRTIDIFIREYFFQIGADWIEFNEEDGVTGVIKKPNINVDLALKRMKEVLLSEFEKTIRG